MKMITDNEHECYICGRWGVEAHHIFFGTANRKLSDKYGLVVPLCKEHHRMREDAVHQNRDTDLFLKRLGQEYFEKNYPELNFMEIFGRNYL